MGGRHISLSSLIDSPQRARDNYRLIVDLIINYLRLELGMAKVVFQDINVFLTRREATCINTHTVSPQILNYCIAEIFHASQS